MTFIGLVPNFYANVKSFGALGDGVADDTSKIQDAINSLPDSGGTIITPPGTYKITAPLITPASMYGGFGCIGAGWGSIWKLANGVNDYLLKFNTGSSNGMIGAYVANMKFDCNGTNQSGGGGVNAFGAYRCKFDHIWVHNPYDNGLWIQHGPG